MSKCKVYLLDDHKIIRDGIKSILLQTEYYEVSGEAGDPVKFLEELQSLEFNILLLDISLPNISGFQIIPQIRKERPDVKIMVLSMHNDPEFMQRCLMLGAHGYLSKDADSKEFIKAMDSVREGKTFSSVIIETNYRSLESSGVLTQREIEVLRWLSHGHSSKQIGAELSISARTVETHRLNIMKKLGTSNSAETISVAAKLNII